MAVAAEGRTPPAELPVEPSLDEVRELAREHNLVPLRHTLHRRLRDAGLGLPEAARARPAVPGLPARVRRAGPARRALVVHRRAPAQGRALVAGRRRRPLRARRRRGRRATARRRFPEAAAVRRRRGRLLRLRPRAHRRAARRAQPRRPRAARHGADALRRARRLRPPQAHGHDPRQRLRRRRRPRRLLRRRAGDDRRRRAACSPGRCPRAEPTPAARAARRSSPTCRASSSRRWSRGSSSTSTPATPSRSCPRSAGQRRARRSSRSRSTAACASVNPSPYMYFLDFGDFQIAGASPEPLLTVTGRHVSTRPIAGTRPRGADAEEDARIAEELLADEKERAEHVMLVDLGRNDLGRVCEYGTVDGRQLHGGRDLLARHAHRLVGLGHAARGRRRDGRAALGAARGHAVAARRRSARCRSSTSSSRSSAAATAARSAT